MIRFDCITLFPEMFAAVTESGITRRALEERRWQWQGWNPRDFAENTWRRVDDRPFGGGPGMLMQPGPLEKVIAAAKAQQREAGLAKSRVIYLSPQGAPLTHERVMQLATGDEGLILLCGRFVLSGGELPAMALIDAVVRQLPGVLGDAASAAEDSFVGGLLDCPHYTRPEVYEGEAVPEVLLSGDHKKIRRWRLKQSLARTRKRRPDLLAHRSLTAEEAQLLTEIVGEEQCGE